MAKIKNNKKNSSLMTTTKINNKKSLILKFKIINKRKHFQKFN